MEMRRTFKEDISRVMEIVREAQSYFRSKGIQQWQNGYPNEEIIMEDIKNGHSYVLVEDNYVVATVAISFDGEDTYNKIYNGSWLSDNEFAVIHRIATTSQLKGQGIASIILKKTEDLCKERNIHSIKIDTHKDNLSMQRLMTKNGYKYCGIILIKDGSERVAFEKII